MEGDIFASLRMGIKFDTKRFKKDIDQFEKQDPASESESEGMIEFSQIYSKSFHVAYKISLVSFLNIQLLDQKHLLTLPLPTNNACR